MVMALTPLPLWSQEAFIDPLGEVPISELSQGDSEAHLTEPALPTERGDQDLGNGFFPTLMEMPLLRGPYDARSASGNYTVDSPDRRAQNATDIFPYASPESNFYQRHPQVFGPADQFLGFFTSFDTLTYENDRLRNFSASIDANTGLLTRAFSPELAMIKAGPLFIDILWLGTGVLWSDYDGPLQFREGEEPGFTGFVEMGLRVAARLTDTIYFTVGANIMYLPFVDRWAFQSLTGYGPAATASLLYADNWADWDVSFYNVFRAFPGLNVLNQLNEPGFDRAGRYAFGIRGQRRANDFYNEEGVFFNNRLGASANRLVFNNEWRLNLVAEHVDFWRTFDFVDHTVRDMAGISLGYEGSVIPFAPLFSYRVFEPDGLARGQEIYYQQLGASFTGRLTENINWDGNIGYLFVSGRDAPSQDSILWNMGFTHTVSQNLLHWLRFGQGFFANEFINEYLVSRYVSYGVNYRLDRRSTLDAFVQYADRELSLLENEERQSWIAGASLGIQLLDFTRFNASVIYNQIDPNSSIPETERWIYRASLTQQLSLRLTGTLFYQYEDFITEPTGFNEHLVGMSLRRYF